jgi:hypothetical protein
MRETVQERWIEPSKLMKPSSKSYRESHLAAVRNIAEQLFAYPTPEYPHFRTFVNEPEPEQKVFTNLGRELAPDIVVLEWPEKVVRIVAEVATPDMLTEEMAEKLWAVEANLADVMFYLYVPAGHASETKKLLKKAKVKNVKLRTWRHITGLKTIDVAPLRV